MYFLSLGAGSLLAAGIMEATYSYDESLVFRSPSRDTPGKLNAKHHKAST